VESRSRTRSVAVPHLVIAAAAALLLLLAACSSSSSAPSSVSGGTSSSAQLTNFTAIAGGVGVNLADLWVAQSKGYYKDEGLNVTLVIGAANTVPLVVGGRGEVASSGVSSALPPVAQGVQTSMIYAQTSATVSAFVVGNAEVKTINDCKTVATNAVGTGAYAYAVAYKQITHANYQLIPIGDPTQVATTLIANRADCGISSYDFLLPSLSHGFHVVVNPTDPSTRPVGFIQAGAGQGLWGVSTNLTKDRAEVVKYLTAIHMADQWMAQASPNEIATELRMNKDWQAIPAATIAAEVGVVKSLYAPYGGQIPPDTWASDIKYFGFVISDFNPDAPQWSYGQRVDMSYLNAATK
jgi:NitT/TauT family transport system substrate-binding protein